MANNFLDNISIQELKQQKSTLHKVSNAFTVLKEKSTTLHKKNLCEKIVEDCDNLAVFIDELIQVLEKKFINQ